MSGDYNPVNDADRIPLTASATITEGQLLSVSGVNTVAPAAAGAVVIGVAAFAAASGTRVTVLEKDMEHETTTTNGVTAGDVLISGTSGVVETAGTSPAAATVVGVALTTAAALAKARWKGL
jgi:hypothetical protein